MIKDFIRDADGHIDWATVCIAVVCITAAIAIIVVFAQGQTGPQRYVTAKATAKAECLDAGNTFNDGNDRYWCTITPRGR